MKNWPFDLWLHYAVRALALSPAQFWSLSIRDWMCLLPKSGGGMTRAALAKLMRLYPDEETHD